MKYKLFFFTLIVGYTCNAQSLPDLIKNGYAKIAVSDFQGAEQDFATAIRVNEPLITAYLAKLKKYSTMNEYQISVSDMPDGFVYNRDYALPYYGHGLALEGLLKQDEAIADYEKAITIDPKYVDAICQRGLVLIIKDLKDKGCIDLLEAKKQGNEKAAELFEKNACSGMNVIFVKSGNTKYEAKDYQGAHTDYTYAIQLNADSADAFKARAQCNVALKKYDKAIIDFNRALQIKPDTLHTIYLRGNAYLSAEQYKAAFDDFSRVIKKDPNGYDLYMQRAAACEGMNNLRSAIYDYSEAIRINAKEGNAFYLRALAKQEVKDATACTDFKIAASLGIEEAKMHAQGCQ
ncbi:MAG: tetratricopeptide repeat protein [Bacteroidota bacterium]